MTSYDLLFWREAGGATGGRQHIQRVNQQKGSTA